LTAGKVTVASASVPTNPSTVDPSSKVTPVATSDASAWKDDQSPEGDVDKCAA
jgi:hypothetical protein